MWGEAGEAMILTEVLREQNQLAEVKRKEKTQRQQKVSKE